MKEAMKMPKMGKCLTDEDIQSLYSSDLKPAKRRKMMIHLTIDNCPHCRRKWFKAGARISKEEIPNCTH